MNYARRQQLRRLSRAGKAAIACAGTMLLALVVASAGAVSAAGVLLVLALRLGLYAPTGYRSPGAAAWRSFGGRGPAALAPVQAEG